MLDRSKIQTLNSVPCILPDGDAASLARIIHDELGATASQVSLSTNLAKRNELLAFLSVRLSFAGMARQRIKSRERRGGMWKMFGITIR
jgi:hypothetical protein